jgi:hypothetical protein
MAETLHAQILRAEQRLLDRRRRLGVGGEMFGQHVRKQLTSPGAFLVAGGLGFVAGDLARCGAGPKAPASSVFTNALSIVTLIHSVFTMVQAATAGAVERGEEGRDQAL